MTRTSTSGLADASFDVPDLDVPELDVAHARTMAIDPMAIGPAREPAAPASPSGSGVRYEHTFLSDSHEHDAPASRLELDGSPRELPQHFVSGIAAPSLPVSRYGSGVPVSLFEPHPQPLRADPPFSPPSPVDVAVDAIQTLPMDVWNRVPTYAFLALLLGNGCKCGGLGTGTNIVLGLLLLIGLVGVAGSLAQRSP